jgi:hypothetical protein
MNYRVAVRRATDGAERREREFTGSLATGSGESGSDSTAVAQVPLCHPHSTARKP